MKSLLVVLLAVLAGCTFFQQTQIPTDQPELISMAPLPPLRPMHPVTGLRLTVMMHVTEDGTVDQARMVGSSGDLDWDSLAVKSVKEWVFVPSIRNGVAIDYWIRQLLIVQVQDPIIMPLVELEVATLQEADSIHTLLVQGMDIDSIIEHPVAGWKVKEKVLGPVNLSIFAPHIREAVKDLRDSEITPPLRRGGKYVIFKRLSSGISSRLAEES